MIWNRIKLYVISLWLLFFLIIVKDFELIEWYNEYSFNKNLWILISSNYLSTLSFTLLILGIVFLFDLRFKVKGSHGLPMKITKIKNLNYEHLTFLTTYIIPFICFEMGDLRDLIIFIFLLIVIGAIYVKTNLFYSNPTLALLGYQIYSVETETETDLILIAQSKLNEGASFTNLEIGDAVYYAKYIPKPKANE